MLHRYAFVLAAVSPLLAQTAAPAPRPGVEPIYTVTIVGRSTPAINYGYRSEPTRIGFAGTALLPGARGEATVEGRRGDMLVTARFERMPPASSFGPDYMTYVVWAVSPDGRAQNLGELVLDASNRAKLSTSTHMQAFALIVTAEPHAAVSRPSDLVVMENRVGEGTVGRVETVNASSELLQRDPVELSAPPPPAPAARPVSQHEYDAIVALYEAENAIRIARAADAARCAPERLASAEALLGQARTYSTRDQSREVIAVAREAAQAAEDAKTIALRRGAQLRLARAEQDAQRAEAEKAASAAAAAQQQLADARAADQRAQQELAEAQRIREQQQQQVQQRPAAPPPAIEAAIPAPSEDRMRDAGAKQNRARLTEGLRAQGFQTLDTPRGVVAIVPAAMLNSNAGRDRVRMRLSALAPTLKGYQALRIDVEGYTDQGGSPAAAQADANLVGGLLTGDGLPASEVTARGMGDSRPVASNRTAAGREENRRVEIVINGDNIGDMPVWDHAYALVTK